MIRAAAAVAVLLTAGGAAAQASAPQPGEAGFRSLYKELVETNTTFSAGNCTLAAERMAARLKAAGFADKDVTLVVPPDHPKDGNLVAVLAGSDPAAKAVLLLAHIDVVEAKRADWTRDPFTLVEEGGYFYARGSSDDKAQAAIWTDLLIRLRQEGYKPRRGIKMALTCGEEGGGQVNGAAFLAQNRRDLIDAAFALNEGAGGDLDASGKRVAHNIQAGEKTSVGFTLEVTNPGGHSSRPVPDNAIYHLVRAVDRISRYEFPVQLNDATRAYFTKTSRIVGGEMGAAMTAIVANTQDRAALRHPLQGRELPRDPRHHLRGDPAGGGPRRERPAAAGDGHDQLPHLPGRVARRGAPDAGAAGRRPEGGRHLAWRQPKRQTRHGRSAADGRGDGAHRGGLGADVAGRSGGAGAAGGWHRRPVADRRGHPHLRRLRHLLRPRPQPHPWPERAHPRLGPPGGPRVQLPPDQALHWAEAVTARYAFTKGRLVIGLPVSLKRALATAGITTGVPGSPAPLGWAVEGRM